MPSISDRMELQCREFNALELLIEKYRSLPAIVDDSYPEARHYFERAMQDFLQAAHANGRVGNSFNHVRTISLQRALRWHPKGIDSWSLSDWGVALAGEAGELCNVIKKMNRLRDGLQQKAVNESELITSLAMEIGDVYLYLDLIAQRAGLKIEDCIKDTFNRVSERESFPERL